MDDMPIAPTKGTSQLRSVCVFCGSSPGADPTYAVRAVELGELLARKGITLVYGGGHVGLMGVIADAVLSQGGQVTGVITRALRDKEVAHEGLTSLTVVETMHERKAAMADLADAFVMIPGGLGTLEEFLEAATWTQLGIQHKPCAILNVGGYFDPLLALFETAVDQRFLHQGHSDMLVIETVPEVLLDRLSSWNPVTFDKWLDRSDR